MEMRFLIELQYSWISFDESDEEKAWELYKEQGKRIFKCEDIFDEGILLAGPPVIKDLIAKEYDEENRTIQNDYVSGYPNNKQFN